MNFPQRIALLSVHTSPLAALGAKKTGGMNVYIRDFSRELVRRGVEVDVFTRVDSIDLPPIHEDDLSGFRVVHVPAGPLHALSTDDITPYLSDFAACVHHMASVYRWRYDLIHSHYWLSGLVGEQLSHQWGRPFLHMYHTLGHMKNRIAQHRSEFASHERLTGESYVAHVADRLIAATPAEETQLVELYGADVRKIRVIPPGVDLRRFQPMEIETARVAIGFTPRCRVILFVGRIEPLKGIDSLLRAIAILREQAPQALEHVHVAIIGGDPGAEQLDAEMLRLQTIHRELDLRSLVTFLGAKDQEILPAYYAAADMVIMPSHYESFGMVGLEAMAMGTPVIASRVGGLVHLVQDGLNGYLVPPRTPEALAERILHLLTNEAHRQQLGLQAQRYAQQFSWSQIVDRMLAVYEEAVIGDWGSGIGIG
jgi:D-inositol-3-phosphate glycosyltransferase